MSYTIRNKTIRPMTIVLDHPEAKRSAGYVYRRRHDPKTGKVTNRREWVSIPRSLTLLGHEEQSGLPDWMRNVSDVKRKVRSGKLELVREQEPTKPKKPTRRRTRKKAQE